MPPAGCQTDPAVAAGAGWADRAGRQTWRSRHHPVPAVPRPHSWFPLGAIVGAVWLAATVGPPWALARWRAERLEVLSRPAVQAEWDAFREAMRRESGRDGPVQRKVPKSAEPPELVWLRDYFALAVTAWVALVGVLGGCLAVLVLGAAGTLRVTARGSPGP